MHIYTPRIDSIKKNGMDWVKELGQKNVEDLLTIIQWNEDNVRASAFIDITISYLLFL